MRSFWKNFPDLQVAESWLRQEGYHFHAVVKNPIVHPDVKHVQEWARDVVDFVFVFVLDEDVTVTNDPQDTQRTVATHHCALCGRGGHGRAQPKVCRVRGCGLTSEGGVYCPDGHKQ